MSTKYVRIVPSSEAAGSSLSGEIAQAFERIRERAYAIYDSRAEATACSEFEDWLQAERELFETPDIAVDSDGEACRLMLHAEALAERPLTIILEPALVTVLGHRMADGGMTLFRRINLPEPIDPDHARLVVRRGSGIQIVMDKPGAADAAPEGRKAMSAAAGREVVAA